MTNIAMTKPDFMELFSQGFPEFAEYEPFVSTMFVTIKEN